VAGHSAHVDVRLTSDLIVLAGKRRRIARAVRADPTFAVGTLLALLAEAAPRAGSAAAIDVGFRAAALQVVATRGYTTTADAGIALAIQGVSAALIDATLATLSTAAIDVTLPFGETLIHTVGGLTTVGGTAAHLAIIVEVAVASQRATPAVEAAAVRIGLEPVQRVVAAATFFHWRREGKLRRSAGGGAMNRRDQTAHNDYGAHRPHERQRGR
jgi:hypothetical protein